MQNEYYVHDLDPFFIKFPEVIEQLLTFDLGFFALGPFPDGLGIRWYGLAYLAGFLAGYWTVRILIRRRNINFNSAHIMDVVTYVALGVVLGGRLGYTLFYSPELIFEFTQKAPFWGVLKVHEGGMSSHGGFIGVMIACWLFARRYNYTFLHILDLTVYGSALGFFFGRLANFINGELFGRAIESKVPWAVQFPSEMRLWGSAQVSKLLELGPAAEALGRISSRFGESVEVTEAVWRGWVLNYRTDMGSRGMVERGIDELIRASQNGQTAVIQALGQVLTPRHPSQLYQAVLEGLLVFCILLWTWRKPQKEGVLAFTFGTCYMSARIIGEQFRMPDAHIGFQALGLTRGQWLSSGLLMIAIVLLIWCKKREVEPR